MTIVKRAIVIGNRLDLPIVIGKVYIIDNQEVVVFQLSNGEIHAIENKSPHPKGGRLADGLVSGEYLYCPLHDWKISLKNGQVQAPDNGEVKTFEVKLKGDQVSVTI